VFLHYNNVNLDGRATILVARLLCLVAATSMSGAANLVVPPCVKTQIELLISYGGATMVALPWWLRVKGPLLLY